MEVVKNIDAIVIAASTGGPKALYSVITKLPGDIGVPILVVQHMPAGMTKDFAERLNNNCELLVKEASENCLIEKNVVFIAPGGFHMEVGKDKKIHLNKESTVWGVRPAADKLFVSAAQVYGKRLLGIVLTGMGKDGSNGIIEIKAKGGVTISEDEASCVIYGMPKSAVETGMVDKVVPLELISSEIVNIVKGTWRGK